MLNFIDVTNKEILSYLLKNSELLLTINAQEFKGYGGCPDNLNITYYKTILLEKDLNENNYFGIYPRNPENSYSSNNKLFFHKQFDSVLILWHSVTYKSNLLYFIIDSIIPNETYLKSADTNYDYIVELSSLTYLLKNQYLIMITGVKLYWAYEENRENIEKSDGFVGSSDTAFTIIDYKGLEHKCFYYILKFEEKIEDLRYSLLIIPYRNYPHTLGIEFAGGSIPSTYFIASLEDIISSYDDLDNNIRLDQFKRNYSPPYEEGQHIFNSNLPMPSDVLLDYPLIKGE